MSMQMSSLITAHSITMAFKCKPHFFILYYLFYISPVFSQNLSCATVDFNADSIVCACNLTYCDNVPRIGTFSSDLVYVYTSSRSGLRFRLDTSPLQQGTEATPASDTNVLLSVDPSQIYQTILGFGAAFTDSSVSNIRSLQKSLQQVLLRNYFSPTELSYSFGRVPIACTDFSYRTYSYDQLRGDVLLAKFSLTAEDTKGKIPLIKEANAIAGRDLKLIASTWGAPSWMKTDKKIQSGGKIRPQYYDTLAKYHVRFLKAYRFHGLNVWAITTGNEPENGLISTSWSPEELNLWIGKYFGPKLKSTFPNVKRMLLDGSVEVIPRYSLILNDTDSRQYIDYWGVHSYPSVEALTYSLQYSNSRYPDIPVLQTEYCTGIGPQPSVVLGSWSRGEKYGRRILKGLNNFSIGWLDWNLALNTEGGPSWYPNYVDSPIIIANPTLFYKQPTFYFQGHFSAFIPPMSRRISVDVKPRNAVDATAAITPEGDVVIVIINMNTDDINMTLQTKTPSFANVALPGKSIVTLLYKKEA